MIGLVRWLLVFSLFLTGIFLLRPWPVKGLRATFLDVGQGDGICLESGSLTVLVDGGSSDQKNLGEQVLEPFLKYSGIRMVDYVIISHGDEDHISGIRQLLEGESGIRIGCLVLPVLGQGDSKYQELAELAERSGASVHWMEAGDRIAGSELQIRCLYAGDENYRRETNDHSLLLEVSCGRARILLTGDISAEGEKRWLEKTQGDSGLSGQVQILKVAHHGSNYSSSSAFLEYVDPDWAVISCGENNRYGHPGGDTLKRLEEQGTVCFLTMERGAVMMTAQGGKITVRTMLPSENGFGGAAR